MLVPEAAAGAAEELDPLREACGTALAALRAAGADRTVVVGGGADTADRGADPPASLRPYGVPVDLGPAGPAGTELPLSLTIGRWLLERAFPGPAPDRYQEVAADAAPEECLRLGAELVASAERVALLVMGDGTACRGSRSPGYYDERAEPYDTAVAAALAAANPRKLARLSPSVGAELGAEGRAAWQVLAGAALAGGADAFSGRLLFDEAPYGVGYFVAAWRG
ncbi:hypothetical protein CLV72_1011265 [Allonocardiopsis opalescens]|uniref:Catalytic LigB subunit of aromatic ring-opening dioxygenase n=2 Tax=Allonocardiopsis opalescens TaxID=1144618 RepID=A0A2T0QFH1_9ACTN|nr:hypothetical protein CLV72_1011265 [Allonocardiopsis opalescens]